MVEFTPLGKYTLLGSGTFKSGWGITISTENIKINYVIKKAECTSTKVYILDTNNNVLTSATFEENKAFFGGYELTASTRYALVTDKGGATGTIYRGNNTSYPISAPYFSITGNWYFDDYGSTGLQNILTVDISVKSGTIGSKWINKNYPFTDGLTAETTSQTGHKEWLEPTEGSLIYQRNKRGL